MTQAAIELNRVRQERLFALLASMRQAGAAPRRLSEMDACVAEARAGLFLKHDVHGLDLDGLERFAERAAASGIFGSYFFMAPDHPLTAPHYDWPRQARSMRCLREMGHELGLHIDGYFLIDHLGEPLARLLASMLNRFEREGLTLTIGNMHGNSRHKHADLDGFGTMFDLFEELGRQPDYPALARVPEESAALIRANRVSIRDSGFTHWADMPMWSARYGFIVTNFVTDNQLGKRGTIETLVHEESINAYKLCDHQRPGSRTPAPARETIALTAPCTGPFPAAGSEHVNFDSEAIDQRLALMSPHPVLCLLHPEFYC